MADTELEAMERHAEGFKALAKPGSDAFVCAESVLELVAEVRRLKGESSAGSRVVGVHSARDVSEPHDGSHDVGASKAVL